MPISGLHHAVLSVPDLEAAESYYRELLDMGVLFREGTLSGTYGKVPDGVDWAVAKAHGVEPGMSFLRRDDFVLALAADPETSEPTRFDHLALEIDLADLGSLASRAAEMGCGVSERETSVVVTDRYGVEWELSAEGFPPSCPFEELDL
ncbi:MAG: VOC family protein [Halodesulfurarchaeum sp.]